MDVFHQRTHGGSERAGRKNKNGEIFIDKTYKADGRGVYICKQKECLAKAVKSKALNRAFKSEVDSQTIEELSKFFEN